jgi:hypothetical protein
MAMPHRISTCGAALGAAFLTAAPAVAQVVDFSRYPDLSGQWDRRGPPISFLALSGAPPLTAEYQKRYEKSLAEQSKGQPGNWPTTYCLPEGMPALMNVYNPIEVVITPETTYIITSHNNDVYRRIYTDDRDWPADPERTLVGYSIGRWIDENSDGKYTTLEVETRFLRGPRAYEVSGIPFHDDNQTIIKERLYLDKADRNVFYDDIVVLDHAMTRPYGRLQKIFRKPDPRPVWRVETCPADNVWIKIGSEAYVRNTANGKLMPAFKDQPPPDLSYFGQSHK